VVSTTDSSDFDAVGMETITLPARSRATGATLKEIAPSAVHGVQIAGIRRGAMRILNPSADECLCGGDELLALGTPDRLRAFKVWAREVAPLAAASGSASG